MGGITQGRIWWHKLECCGWPNQLEFDIQLVLFLYFLLKLYYFFRRFSVASAWFWLGLILTFLQMKVVPFLHIFSRKRFSYVFVLCASPAISFFRQNLLPAHKIHLAVEQNKCTMAIELLRPKPPSKSVVIILITVPTSSKWHPLFVFTVELSWGLVYIVRTKWKNIEHHPVHHPICHRWFTNINGFLGTPCLAEQLHTPLMPSIDPPLSREVPRHISYMLPPKRISVPPHIFEQSFHPSSAG